MNEPLELERLADPSRAFARELCARRPELGACCTMEAIEGLPGLHLVLRVASPAGPDRDVTLWMEGGDEPSLAFGAEGWHVHGDYTRCVGQGDYEDESLIDLLEAILGDEVVLIDDPGTAAAAFGYELDLRDPSALPDELTHPTSSGKLRIRSFTGAADRVVTLADLAG